MKRSTYFIIFFHCLVIPLWSQSPNISVELLTNAHIDTVLNQYLAGEGVVLSNGMFNNQSGIITSNQIGLFQCNEFTDFSIASGLVMCTGDATVAVGPNNNSSASLETTSSYVESMMTPLATNVLYDCASLDFDFMANSDTFVFRYIFASEEYCEYVYSDFNDFFAFFLTGPDPVTQMQTTKNIAIIPGSISASDPNGLPVSINNVNHGYHGNDTPGPGDNPSYSQYFIHNDFPTGTQFDGYTAVLEAGSTIQPCVNYHMKLSICDAGDSGYDSGVFLEENSFQSHSDPQFTMNDTFCLHDDIVLYYQAQDVDSVHIITPQGDTLWNPPFVIANAQEADTGLYYLCAKKNVDCYSSLWTKDSIFINIHVPYISELCSGLDYCAGSEVSYSYTYDSIIGPWVTYVSDSMFTIAPPDSLTNDTTVLYTLSMYDPSGCHFDTTVQAYIHTFIQINFDSTVCNRCIWYDDTLLQSGNYTYTIPNPYGCDTLMMMALHVNPTPTALISGPSALCSSSAVTLTSDSAFSYLWSTGDTTQSTVVSQIGDYSLTVTNEYGCTAATIHQILEMNNPILSITMPEMCAGGSYTLSVGHQDSNNIFLGQGETTLSLADTIFLPDGIYCDPYGCSYRSPLTFTAYANDATIQSANDIYYVRLNMEHSWIGDLYINITCPNGQKADLLKYGGSGSSECNSQIASSSRGWAAGNNIYVGNFLGNAYDYGVNSCDGTAFGNEPGIGWNYCWSNNSTQGYAYAPGEGSLIYRSENAHYGIVDSSNVAAGTQFYHPDDSFNSLIGCPLNGSWFIEVQDGWGQDNGYIFGWELALSTEMLPEMEFVLDYSTVDGPWVSTLSDSLFLLTPPEDLSHDTVIAYTFSLYDSTGCSFDTTVYISFYALPFTEIDTSACGTFIWNDSVYTESGQYLQQFALAYCDSTVVLNLTMNTPSDSTLHVIVHENDLPFTLNNQQYDSTGTYYQVLTNAAGCDSTLTIEMTVLYNVTVASDTIVCDSMTWIDNVTYYASTDAQYVLTAANGCDSILILHLTVNHSSNDTSNIAVVQNNLPYILNETSYTSPGTYTQHFTSSLGCDSTINLHLTVYYNVSSQIDTTVCASELPFTWHGHSFTAAGLHYDTLLTSHGADSAITYHLMTDNISATINNVTHITCEGESTGAATGVVSGGQSPLTYTWTHGGTSIATSTSINNRPAGAYTFTVTDNIGCSASATTTLNTLNEALIPGTIAADQDVCIGEDIEPFTGTVASGGDNGSYHWQISTNGTDWTTAPGTSNTQNYNYPTPATNAFQLRRAWISQSCGTAYSNTIAVNVWPNTSDTITVDLCQGAVYQENGFDITSDQTSETGEYTYEQHFLASGHCDSAVFLLLTVHPISETTLEDEVCEGKGYHTNGFSINPFETVGEVALDRSITLQSANGCDSIIQLHLSIIDTSVRIVSLTPDFCDEMYAELMVVTEMPNYVWSTGETSPTITVTATGVYEVTATQDNCIGSSYYRVNDCLYEFILPNTITPSNGDGLNDWFCIPEEYKKNISLFKISIFNRWGEMVYYSTDKNFKWNGEYRGEIQYQTIYNYIIDYTTMAGKPNRIIGSITVL